MKRLLNDSANLLHRPVESATRSGYSGLLLHNGHSPNRILHCGRSAQKISYASWSSATQRERVLATDSFLVAQFTARYKLSTEAGEVHSCGTVSRHSKIKNGGKCERTRSQKLAGLGESLLLLHAGHRPEEI
jgi:hypothetical protein